DVVLEANQRKNDACFFFQAEDGIRDYKVTGVQTCALPISLKAAGWTIIAAEMRYVAKSFPDLSDAARKDVTDFLNALDDHDDVRSEERRVGKECRSWWSWYT